MGRRIRRLPLLVLLGVACGCADLTTGPGYGPVEIGEADVRILFVGNSLTYVNDLPAVVAELAAAADRSVAYATLASPNYSLQEHWYAGLAEEIRESRPDIVVLQQGPSTLPSSRAHLVYWTEQIAPVVREVGGVPALLMVWPDLSRRAFFDDCRDSYAAAAAAVDGIFIPAGQTWVEGWAIEPSLPLYGPDAFHPAYLGTLAAAETVAAVLLGLAPEEVPSLDDGVDESVREILREALRASLEHAAPAS